MHTRVIGKFRVKRGGHSPSLADHHRIAALSRQNFYAPAHALDLRCPDKNHFDRGLTILLIK